MCNSSVRLFQRPMPKLLLLAPCDNILINKGAESASLIVIFTQVTFPTPPPDLAPGMHVPMRWFLFCQWEMLAEDTGITFDQKIAMNNGQGVPVMTIEQSFAGEEGKMHSRVIAGAGGFPVVDAGTYRITASLRKNGETEWVEQGSYPLVVNHADADGIGTLV
jgi:hypothetical protein